MSCRELANLIATDELAGAGWGRWMGVRMHLLMCRHCRRYARQMSALGVYARKHWGSEPLDPDALQRLERDILERCLGHPEGPIDTEDLGRPDR